MSIGQNIKDALGVAFSPSKFYLYMSKSGGLVPPALFVLTMSVLAVLLCAVGALFSSDATFFGTLFGHIIPYTLKVFITVIIASIALYFLWGRLGSKENFETSFRSVAYASAIAPLWIVLTGLLGVIGKFIAVIWLLVILVAASTAVHGVQRRSALISLVILAVLLALLNRSFCDEQCGDRNNVGANDDVTEAAALVKSQETVVADESVADETSALISEDELIEEASKTLLAAPKDLEDEKIAEDNIELASDESLLEQKAEQAGEILGGLVKELDSTVEKAGAQITSVAEDFKQGFDKSQQGADSADNVEDSVIGGSGVKDGDIEDSSEAVVEVVEENVADNEVVSQSEETSMAEAAGQALSDVVDGVEGIVENVKKGYQKSIEATEDDVEPSQNGSSKEKNLTPEKLGEAMAEFLQSVDKAAGESSGEIESAAESAVEAFERFMNSFQEALERDQENSEALE